MFYVRIVLIVGKSIDFDGITDFETVVFQKEHIKCLINKKDTLLTRRIIYSYGPFLDSKDAKQEGYKLYIKIIKSYILKKIPISINDNIAINDVSQISIQNASTSNEGREIIRKKLNIPEGIEIFDEVLGLDIYELQGDISSAKFLIHELNITTHYEPFDLISNKDSDKYISIYSIINACHFVNDDRVKFILLITAIESIVADDKKESHEYCQFIEIINKNISENELLLSELHKIISLDSEFKNMISKIKSTLLSSKNKSISTKCCELIESCKLTDKYAGKDPVKFWKECYEIRSKFVHTGLISKEVVNSVYLLEDLVFKVLDKLEESI